MIQVIVSSIPKKVKKQKPCNVIHIRDYLNRKNIADSVQDDPQTRYFKRSSELFRPAPYHRKYLKLVDNKE